jgi:hypothetical protein
MPMRNAGGKASALALLCALALLLSGCGDQSAAYDTALGYFGNGDYAAAADAFSKLGDYLQAGTYAAYSQGLTFWEQGNYTAAEPYFEQTQSFMYGGERYRYCHADALEEAGQIAEAAQWFSALGEYEDAPQRAAYCRALDAVGNADYETALINYQDADGYSDAADRLDALQFEIYERAASLRDAKDYGQAFTLFTMLGENYDAQEQARVCKNYFLDQSYTDAEALIASGDLQGAYDAFNTLSGYRDAAARADELAAQLGLNAPEVN